MDSRSVTSAASQRAMPVGGRSFLDAVLALLILGLFDIVLFHFGGYFGQLQPASYSGRLLDSSSRLEAAMARRPQRRMIVAIGDSTSKSAIDAANLTESVRSAGFDYQVFNFSQPGSTSRSWYQLLKHERFDASSTALVIVGVLPTALRLFDRPKPDLSILKTEVRMRDGWALSRSYSTLDQQLLVQFGTVFRTLWFRDDLKDHLLKPGDRRREIRRHRSSMEERRAADSSAEGPVGSMVSVRLNSDGDLLRSELPAHLENRPAIHATLELWLRNRELEANREIDFDPRKLEMLERLVRTLDRRGIPVLVAVLPKMKAVFRHRDIAPLRQTIGSLQLEGHRVTWFEDSATLARLEAPEYFADHLHLNARGARVYSEAVGDAIVASLGGSP